MNDLQKKQLDILVKYDEVCRKHNLRYFLCGGTCLGAIRHKGFIPWDDDIDVSMPRKDYEKFITLQSEFGDKYFIQTYKSDPHYVYNFAKVRDNETTYIENFFSAHKINHGVWIDVFPMDGVVARKGLTLDETAKKNRKKMWRNVYLSYLFGLTRKINKHTFFRDILFNICAYPFFWLNLAHLRNKRIDKWCKRYDYDNESYIADYYWDKKAYPKEVFGEGIDGEFEGYKFKIPSDAHTYLTKKYGDYMKLPPEDQREGHHYDKGFDLNKSYVQYQYEHRK